MNVDGSQVLFEDPNCHAMKEMIRRAIVAGVSLDGADLSGCDLTGLELTGASLRGASLDDATLDRCRLSTCDLSGASLKSTSLKGAMLDHLQLEEARLRRTDLRSAQLFGCAMTGADLVGMRANDAFIKDSALVDVRGGDCDFRDAVIEDCDLHHVSLGESDFTGATLNFVALSNSHMRGSIFSGAHVARSDMSNSDLRGCEFVGTTVLKGRIDDSVLTKARVEGCRFKEVEMTGVRARDARVQMNSYIDCTDLPKEMWADEKARHFTAGLSRFGTWAVAGAIGAGAAYAIPPEATKYWTESVMRGTVGIAVMAGANLALRSVAPWIKREVIDRAQKALFNRSAPKVSDLAGKVPLAEWNHRLDDMRFVFTTGLSEKRINSIVAEANGKQGDRKAGRVAALFGPKHHVIVAEDGRAMERVNEALAATDKSVLVLRLDDEGRVRETGPGFYQFNQDGSMQAIWYNLGKPDFGTSFGADHKAVAHRAYSGRVELVNGDKPLPTRLLERRETRHDQAVSWLKSDQGDGLSRLTSHDLIVNLRRAGHYLRTSSRFLGRDQEEARKLAIGAANVLEKVGAGKADKVAPQQMSGTIGRTREAMGTILAAMEKEGVPRLSAVGRDLEGRLAKMQEQIRDMRPQRAVQGDEAR
nr:pentapeptide repeat-containing protein [Rhodovibrio sodomensis]